MLVFWKQGLVILSMPKTGTTALAEVLGAEASLVIRHPPGLKHINAPRYRTRLEGLVTQRGQHPHEVWTVMREPVDWLGSWYRYRQREGMRKPENSTRGLSFDAFVDAWLEAEPPPYARIGSQFRFLCDDSGMPQADRVFRHDRMDQFLAALSDRLERPIELPRRNVSPPGEVTLGAAMEARLRREAELEFALWETVCAWDGAPGLRAAAAEAGMG